MSTIYNIKKNKEDVTQAASADNDQDTHARSALPSPSSNNNISQGDNVVKGKTRTVFRFLLENLNNFELKIERRQSERSDVGKKRPNTSIELPSVDSVLQEKDAVNRKYRG